VEVEIMGHTLSCRTCRVIDADRESALRRAVDAFNRERTWILSLATDDADGHLRCTMEPVGEPGGNSPEGERPRWPGPYEAKCLLDALCEISGEHDVDWEVWATYAQRPVAVIRGGVCIDDPEAHAEAVRRRCAELDAAETQQQAAESEQRAAPYTERLGRLYRVVVGALAVAAVVALGLWLASASR